MKSLALGILIPAFFLCSCGQSADKKAHGNAVETTVSGGLFGSGEGGPCNKILGAWTIVYTDAFVNADISKDGDIYTINYFKKMTAGWFANSPHGEERQTFSGLCEGGVINTNSGWGNAAYLTSTDSMTFGGRQFTRVTSGD